MLFPWLGFGSNEFGIRAKATVDLMCCKEKGFLAAKPEK